MSGPEKGKNEKTVLFGRWRDRFVLLSVLAIVLKVVYLSAQTRYSPLIWLLYRATFVLLALAGLYLALHWAWKRFGCLLLSLFEFLEWLLRHPELFVIGMLLFGEARIWKHFPLNTDLELFGLVGANIVLVVLLFLLWLILEGLHILVGAAADSLKNRCAALHGEEGNPDKPVPPKPTIIAPRPGPGLTFVVRGAQARQEGNTIYIDFNRP